MFCFPRFISESAAWMHYDQCHSDPGQGPIILITGGAVVLFLEHEKLVCLGALGGGRKHSMYCFGNGKC